MRQAEVIEIGFGNIAECSQRILSAIGAGSLRTLNRELARGARVCAAPLRNPSTLAEEQTELLGAIVDRMRLSAMDYEPYSEAEIYLLGHLTKVGHLTKAQ